MVAVVCTKCKVEKESSLFRSSKRKHNGLQSWCKSCQNAQSVRSHRSGSRKRYMQNYYRANPDKFAAYRAKEDKSVSVQRSRRWAKQNPLKRLEYEQRRRAKKMQNGVFRVTDKELNRLYSSPCVQCGAMDRQTVDHIVPLSRGGRHSIGNLQTLCVPCNSSKNDRLLVEWRVA